MTQEPNLEDMRIFAAVAREESFSKGASVLRISRATVSRRIAALEEALGAQLLRRTTREVSLTETGIIYREQCERVVELAHEATRAVARARDQPSGVLRITAPPLFADMYLSDILVEFRHRYTEVTIDLNVSPVRESLTSRGYDVAIRAGRLEDSALIARTLALTDQLCAASPAYLHDHPEPKHPAELTAHRCIVTRGSAFDDWLFRDGKSETRVRVRGDVRVSSLVVAGALASAGLGIVQLPSFVVADAVRAGELVTLLNDFAPPGTPLSVVYPEDRHLLPKVRMFVDLLVDHFTPGPPWQHDG